MKKVVTKFRLFVLFLLHGKKKEEKKVAIRMHWHSAKDEDLTERATHYRIMIENLHGSQFPPPPGPSTAELNSLIIEFESAKFDYQSGKSYYHLHQLQIARENLRSALQFLRNYMQDMNLTK